MNKLLIVFLAVCLISVHAFVKRDAPAASTTEVNYIEDIKNTLSKVVNDINGKVQEVANPDVIKQQLNKVIDDATKLIQQLNPKKEQQQ